MLLLYGKHSHGKLFGISTQQKGQCDMEMLSKVILVVASLILLTAPVIILMRIHQGKTTPSRVTFGIRSVVSVMNLITYFLGTQHDYFKSAIMLTSALSLSAIFVYSFFKGKTKIRWYDVVTTLIVIVVVIKWKSSGDAMVANLWLQSALLLSFVPYTLGVLDGTIKDHPISWAFATLAYVLMTFGLLLSAEPSWQEFVNPVCIGVVGNGVLMSAITFKNRKVARQVPQPCPPP